MKSIKTVAALAIVMAACIPTGTQPFAPTTYAQSQGGARTFPETGHSVRGRFLDYWDKNGGLAQQGYPLTEEMDETSATDGKHYTVQYFERAVFELHPENKQPYDVLLTLLGVFEYGNRYGKAGAPDQKPSTDSPVLFKETGKTLGSKFRTYWETHGGLAQQGFPISDEFQEKSSLDGKVYIVQYFERAVFELHTENAGTPSEVLLSQLGTFRFKSNYIYPGVTIPILPKRGRFKLVASDRYIVWNETNLTSDHGFTVTSSDILGYDLKENKPIEVIRNGPPYVDTPAISGSIVVYQSQPDARQIFGDDIVAKELATGAMYKLTDRLTGTHGRYPTISGRTVAWIDPDTTGSRVVMRDLDSNTPITVATLPWPGESYFLEPQISQDYLVWSEIAEYERSDPQLPSYVKAYNRKTGITKIAAQFSGNPYGSRAEYALSGHRMFINDPYLRLTPRIIDLDTGKVTPIEIGQLPISSYLSEPTFNGDIVAWSYGGATGEDFDIWGVNLKDGKIVPLAIGKERQTSPVIVGDKLAWLNRYGPDDGGIGIISLSAAFATVPEREKALTSGK